MFPNLDPLDEDERYSRVGGLVHKFTNRVLWKVTYRCAAHCQFCTRYRQIGTSAGDLLNTDIADALSYIAGDQNIEDVILSGGDPLYVPQVTSQILDGLAKINSVRAIRIGTRLPVHSPESFKSAPIKRLVELLHKVSDQKPVYLLIHFNHPDELTHEVDLVLRQLARAGMILMSQTVFLRGINDNKDTLGKLFSELFHKGVIPYYVYRCDSVRGLEHLVCDIELEQQIMTDLTKQLSGIAVPTYVIDVPGRGKIPVPLAFWKSTLTSCTDFDGSHIAI
jgi:lysine 2,3-aminomutase